MSKMTVEIARELFGAKNTNEKYFFAQIPRCVILDKTISNPAKQIYYYLTARTGGEDVTWISQAIIAIDLGCSERSVRTNLDELVKSGLVSIQKQPGTNANIYFLEDIAELYGDLAKAPWPKREHYEGRRAKKEGGDEEENFLTDRKKTSSPNRKKTSGLDRKKTSSKEEEGNEKEFQESEMKNVVAPASTLSLCPAVVSPVKAKVRRYEPEDFSLGEAWLEFALKQRNGKGYPSWTAEGFAETMAKIRARAELTPQMLREVFEFVQEDDFWRPNAISPAGLLTKSKNGLLKIDNLIAAVKGAPKYKTARELEKVRDIEFDPSDIAF